MTGHTCSGRHTRFLALNGARGLHQVRTAPVSLLIYKSKVLYMELSEQLRTFIDEGKDWIPWDQVDYVILPGTCMMLAGINGVIILTMMLVSPILHIATVRLAYAIGIRKQ